jgi:hypothetical protein
MFSIISVALSDLIAVVRFFVLLEAVSVTLISVHSGEGRRLRVNPDFPREVTVDKNTVKGRIQIGQHSAVFFLVMYGCSS